MDVHLVKCYVIYFKSNEGGYEIDTKLWSPDNKLIGSLLRD